MQKVPIILQLCLHLIKCVKDIAFFIVPFPLPGKKICGRTWLASDPNIKRSKYYVNIIIIILGVFARLNH